MYIVYQGVGLIFICAFLTVAGLWLHHFVNGQQQPVSFDVRFVSYWLLEVKACSWFLLMDNSSFSIGSLHFSTVYIVVGFPFGKEIACWAMHCLWYLMS